MDTLLRPVLNTPFPDEKKYWKCPHSGMLVPKNPMENVEWRGNLLTDAEKDPILQQDLMSLCAESLLFWINAFSWTYHQKEVDPLTGLETVVEYEHVPFITWLIQDELFTKFLYRLEHPKDILIDKSRDMGASWCGIDFIHWVWLFKDECQMLEMSRTEDYVDKPGYY